MLRSLIYGILSLSFSVPVLAETLIVGNKREHTVSFIDLTSGDEVRRVSTGKAPHEVAVSPDGSKAVVVSYRGPGYSGNTLHVFDIITGAEIRTIDLGPHKGPHGLKWIGESNRVAATTEMSNHLVIADVETGKVVKALSTQQGGSHMVALAPDNRTAYVANMQAGSFTVLDLKGDGKPRIINAGRGSEAISVSPDGKEVWVGNNNSKNVMVYDAGRFERIATIKTDGIPIRVEISPGGKYVAISEPDLARVAILDRNSRELIAHVDLNDAEARVPVTILWHPDGTRLWVATTQSAKIVEIKVKDWSITRTLAAGEGSDGLGYSPIDIVALEMSGPQALTD